jgi:hypothetical protein
MNSTTAALLNPWSLLTATAGLIAFHIGLYTLVGRERKSPYMINAIFPVFLLCLATATLTLSTLLVPTWIYEYLLEASVAILIAAFALSFVVVYRTTIRFVYFVDKMRMKHLPVIRHLLRWRENISAKPTYSHDSLPIAEDLKKEVIEILAGAAGPISEEEKASPLSSIALLVSSQKTGSEILIQLSKAFLGRGYFVQYVTASRHPIEFSDCLRESASDKSVWQDWAENFIVIDAYSPHFAFIDSIYQKKDREIDALSIKKVTSTMTYAGIHSASSKAFNLFKDNSGTKTRKPTLVIYEGTNALTDLESTEQYRIFVRHVIPSEKMWGGMLTVFIEPGQSASDWELLRSYASIARKIEPVPSVPSQMKIAGNPSG